MAGSSPSRLGGMFTVVTSHIERRLAAATFLVVLAVGFAVMLPGYARLETRFIEDRKRDAIELFRSAVDPDSYPTLEQLTAMGANLAEASDIEGGVFVTGIGEVRASFGELPELDWARARLEARPWHMSEDHSVFEIFLGPEGTGLTYGVILRFDTREAWNREVWRMIEMTALGLLFAMALATAVALMVGVQVALPTRRLKRALDHALNEPETAAAMPSALSRNDQFGALSCALDQLLFVTQHAFEEELAAAQHLADANPHAVLTYSPEGHLLSANAAALRLFEARDEAALRENGSQLIFRFEGRSTTAEVLLADGPAFGHGEVMRAGGIVPCLVGGDVARRPDGSPLQLFVLFVDMTEIIGEVRREVRQRQKAEGTARDLRLQIDRMRAMFDACMVLLELGGEDAPKSQPVTIAGDDLVAGWLKRAVARDIMAGGCVEYAGLPPLLGDPDELRRLFDAVLEVVRLRSGALRPVLAVRATLDGDEATISAWGKAEEGPSDHGTIRAEEDASLFLGAISVLARRNGGLLVAAAAADGGNLVAIRLRVDRRTMALNLDAADDGKGAEAAA